MLEIQPNIHIVTYVFTTYIFFSNHLNVVSSWNDVEFYSLLAQIDKSLHIYVTHSILINSPIVRRCNTLPFVTREVINEISGYGQYMQIFSTMWQFFSLRVAKLCFLTLFQFQNFLLQLTILCEEK